MKVPGHATVSAGHAAPAGRQVQWAVGLASTVAVMIPAAFAVLAAAYAIGGSGATEDNGVGFLVAVTLLAGMLASLAAFALAIGAALTHQRHALRWLPLSLFPALLALVVLGEVFWWE